MIGRRGVRGLAGAVVAGLFVVLIARRVEWAEVQGVLAAASPWPLLVGLAALAADFTARTARWWLMLRTAQPDLPFSRCFRPFLGSLALNNVVPFRAGDVVRVVGFRQALQAPRAHVLGTLVLERILDLLALLAILGVGVAATSSVLPRPFVAGAVAAAALGVVVLATLTASPGLLPWLADRIVPPLARGRAWGDAARGAAGELGRSLALLRTPGLALRLVGLSLLAWVLEGAMFASVAAALHIAVHPAGPWLALGAATLATLLPSSPGYLGTFDYFAILGLTAAGAARAEATAFALLAHVLLWLPVTAVGLLALALGRGVPASAELTPDAA
jgi:uncharacterized membrane protein YbhN (UPF0104 family)